MGFEQSLPVSQQYKTFSLSSDSISLSKCIDILSLESYPYRYTITLNKASTNKALSVTFYSQELISKRVVKVK